MTPFIMLSGVCIELKSKTNPGGLFVAEESWLVIRFGGEEDLETLSGTSDAFRALRMTSALSSSTWS